MSVKQKTPKQSKNKTRQKLRHQYEYADFVQWIALPKSLRSPKTQRELAKKFGVGEDTLSEWKNREDFWNEVEKKRKSWGKERTPNVLMGLYTRAIKSGDPQSVRLWYEIVEGRRFNDKAADIVCDRCEKYAAIEELSDEELKRRIEEQKAFFEKR